MARLSSDSPILIALIKAGGHWTKLQILPTKHQ